VISIAYGEKLGRGATRITDPFVKIKDNDKDILNKSLQNRTVNYIMPYDSGIIAYIKE